MEETGRKAFVGYEYKEITADSDQASFLMDGYENFGWIPDENAAGKCWERVPANAHSPGTAKVIIRMKRNRKILNKMELTRLQRNFEACVREIEELEKSKKTAATICAILIGLAGTVFMAGAAAAFTAVPHRIIPGILLAVPGLLGWGLPCIVYRKMVRKKTKKVAPIIEEKYDEIYEICEKGNRLLN